MGETLNNAKMTVSPDKHSQRDKPEQKHMGESLNNHVLSVFYPTVVKLGVLSQKRVLCQKVKYLYSNNF